MNSPHPNDLDNCTCDLWPDNEPHSHLGAMSDDGPPVPPFWGPADADA